MMTRTVTVILSDQDAEYIDLVKAGARRRGHDLGSMDELALHALLAYADFVDRMHAGRLDGNSSSRLLIDELRGLAPLRAKEIV